MALQHKPLILKNYLVNTLVELLGVPLQAQLARIRNRFILLLNDTATYIESERQRLLKEFAELDEKGELKIGTDGHYVMKNQPEFSKQFEELTSRTFALPCIGEQYTDFVQIKYVLENLETRLSVAQTTIYNEIMEAFEEWAGKPPVEGEEESGATA